jgi:hypothetical protein
MKTTQKQLMRTAKLFIAARRPLTPTRVTLPSYGIQVTASLRFPRYANVTPEEGNVEVSAEAGSGAARRALQTAVTGLRRSARTLNEYCRRASAALRVSCSDRLLRLPAAHHQAVSLPAGQIP